MQQGCKVYFILHAEKQYSSSSTGKKFLTKFQFSYKIDINLEMMIQ